MKYNVIIIIGFRAAVKHKTCRNERDSEEPRSAFQMKKQNEKYIYT